jgi:hypothetical protein
MSRKLCLILICFFCWLLIANAQTIQSVTNLESSSITYHPENSQINYLDNVYFEQSLFWRKRYNKQSLEKDSYFFNSLYLKDSVLGVKYFGFDFNFMHEPFDNSRMNYFRKWNCIRLGFSLSAEHNPFEIFHPINEIYEYLNANIYLKYYHIPKSSRGDKTTKYKKWAWGFFIEAEYFGRIYADLHIKPFNYLWLHVRYRKELYDDKYAALIFEWELNPYGYENCKVESSKDIYHGITLFAGPEYNLYRKTYMLNFGISMKFRNH